MPLDVYRKKWYPKIDPWILASALGLSLFGLMMISSASVVVSYDRFGINHYYLARQFIFFLIAVLAMSVTASFDYQKWRVLALPFFVGTIALLLAVYLPGIGLELGGARRWINLGPVLLQPSELVKLTFVIYLAVWLEAKGEGIRRVTQGLGPFLVLMSIVAVLVISQPDMGTLVIITLIAGVMLFEAGASLSQLMTVATAGGLIFLSLIRSSPYRWQRFLTFLNPSIDILGAGYQINQSLIALGTGGLFGLGFGQSRQKYLYLPQPHTDAIAAIMVEEIGFIRSVLILAVFVFLVYRGYQIAIQAPDMFGRLLATGIVSWIALQTLVNLGAVSGALPLTGLPLPFISYGGSSLVALLAGVGILLNISKYSQRT